eukprot:12913857-Prorocentrum_lima.AAC.1
MGSVELVREARGSSTWKLTETGAALLECCEMCANPRLLFALPDPLPPLADLSSYHLIVVLQRDGWHWQLLPRSSKQ